MSQLMLALATAALFAAATTCAGGATGSSEPEWDLSGVVAAVDRGTPVTRVTVELAGGPEGQAGRAVLLVGPETEVAVQRADGTTRPGEPADLAPGARVLARHTGTELRSLPPQYHATRIRVLAGT